MRNESYLTTYNESIKKLTEIDAKKLIRREELGNELCFADAEEDLEQCINLFKLLIDVDIASVPDSNLNNLNKYLGEFLNCIEKVRTYSAKAGDARRNEIINSFKNNYVNWYNVVTPIIAFTTKAGTDYEALQRKAVEANKQLSEELKQARFERDEAKKEIDNVLETIKRAAAEVGVTQHTTNFKETADKYENDRVFWLRVSIGLIVCIIGFSLLFFVYNPIVLVEPYHYSFLQSVLPRMTGLVALFYGLHIASYTYRAYAHNCVVNRNKQNALATFETFAKAAEDKETKNAVLLQTTKAIFSNLPSGYLKNESATDSPAQIIEVVKNISKGE